MLDDQVSIDLPPPSLHDLSREGIELLVEPRIAPTAEALRQINPAVVVPAHCTGWRAMQRIAQALQEAYTPNSVGTTFKQLAD